jgi:hypothetical protein
VAEEREAAAAEEDVGSAGVGYEVRGDCSGENRRGARLGRGDVDRDEGNVAVDGEGLGEEVGKIVSTWDKCDSKLVLSDPTFDPVKSHVD